MKSLIINADDFGYSRVFNEKILDLAERRLISSVSVMVLWKIENQKEQIEKLKNHNISIGLHFDLDNQEEKYSYEQIKEEISKQFNKFKEIFNFAPHFIDKHKWIYSKDEARAMIDFAGEKNIAIKNSTTGLIEPNKIKIPTTTIRAFSMTKQGYKETINFLETLKDGETYELTCHPGEYDPECESSLNKECEKDYNDILKLEQILRKNDIQLINFKDLRISK